jgi:hypothetical protein
VIDVADHARRRGQRTAERELRQVGTRKTQFAGRVEHIQVGLADFRPRAQQIRRRLADGKPRQARLRRSCGERGVGRILREQHSQRLLRKNDRSGRFAGVGNGLR